MAGSVAYSAFVSLLPLLLLTLLVASAIGGQAFANRVIELTGKYLTPTAQDLLYDALSNASRQASLSILGLVALVWSVLKVFRGLDVAFSSLYHSPDVNTILDQVKDGIIVLVGIGIAVLAMIGASLFLSLVPDLPFVNSLTLVLLVVALTIAFFPIFYVFPDIDVSVGDVLPGTILAAVGWTVLQGVFQLYVRYSSAGELYGAIGGVILLITWLYFGSLVLLLGVALNVVVSGRSEAVRPTPDPDGRRSPE